MVTARPISVNWVIFVLGCAALAGCGKPSLNVNDAVQIGDDRTLILGHAGHSEPLGGWSPVKGVALTFLADGVAIGSAVSDSHGEARIEAAVGLDARTVAVQADIDGQKLHDQATIFHWSTNRTIIVFDIDDTIASTNFTQVFLGGSNQGTVPMDGASQTLMKLASHYNIVYMTARHRAIEGLTQGWLRDNHFPPGPLVMTSDRTQGLDAETFKANAIREARKRAPQMLIGVGNLETDANAYGDNGMLALIHRPPDKKALPARAITFDSWDDIAKFFEANADVLQDPALLSKAIAERRTFRRPQSP
jgi:hypothetical protein